MIGISRRASLADLQFGRPVCSASSSKRFMIACAASRLYCLPTLNHADDLVERIEHFLETFEGCSLASTSFVLESLGDDFGSAEEKLPEESASGRGVQGVRLRDSARQGMRQVRLTAKLICNGVCLKRYAVTIFLVGVLLHLERNAHVFESTIADVNRAAAALRAITTSAMRSTSCDLLTV